MSDPDWAAFGDDKLLAMRMCDLGLTLAGTEVEQRIAQVDAELEGRGLVRPLQAPKVKGWYVAVLSLHVGARQRTAQRGHDLPEGLGHHNCLYPAI